MANFEDVKLIWAAPEGCWHEGSLGAEVGLGNGDLAKVELLWILEGVWMD